MVTASYGEARYQECRNDYHKNGRDSFLVELGKWGLGPRDLIANVNFFSHVDVADDGSMTYHAGNSEPGSYVDLRAEMNVLTILNTCQHPLDPNPKYDRSPSTCRSGTCRPRVLTTLAGFHAPRMDAALR